MAYDNEETRAVTRDWIVSLHGVTETIPAGEKIRIARDANGGSARVFWKGFQKQQLGFSALVTEEDLTAHT